MAQVTDFIGQLPACFSLGFVSGFLICALIFGIRAAVAIFKRASGQSRNPYQD